jgi:UDP-N-acetylglucosamine acyltransferase
MPFATIVTPRASKSFGANATGLERRGFDPAIVENLQNALRLLTRGKLNTTQAIEKIRKEIPACAEVDELIDFIQTSQRGVIK